MSRWAGTWMDRAMAAACAIVIIVGAFAISGHSSAHGGKPKIHPGGVAPLPVTPSASATASRSSRATPSPSGTETAPPSSPAAPATGTPASHHTTATTTPTSVGTTTTSATPIPPGVLGSFSYATNGSEGTNIPGTQRTFPKTTTIKNTRSGCGVLSTWKPIAGHVQSQLLCPDGSSLKIKAYQTTITFFGLSSGENFTCSGDSFIYRPHAKAGQTWKYPCKSADATAHQTAHVIGYSTMSVGHTSVRALHVRVATTLRGSDRGSSTQDYWIWTKKPVLVKETGKVTATQQGVHYQSTYSLTLDSLTPRG